MHFSLSLSLCHSAQISAPQLRLNASEQGIVVRVKTPKAVAKKMLSSHLRATLVYHVYVINEEGKEVRLKRNRALVTKFPHPSAQTSRSEGHFQKF